VVKDPQSGGYFHLGDQEHFLLTQLDGQRTAEAVCRAYQERFGEPLGEEDLAEFLELARGQGLLGADPATPSPAPPVGERESVPRAGKQSLLYWRKSFWDPDRFFGWLEPKIRFFWTRAFLALSAGSILLAILVLWTDREEAASSFADALRWETALWVCVTLMAVTTLHEFAHGLTCKHHGGEVHEIGFLLLFFMPCFYCNVSDAWLFKEKSKRLWVTLAGGYFELFVWSLAVFAWRLTLPGTLPHYLAFVVVASCGIDSLFNFNPLLKLDGYYLLSDWLEVPNLQQRALRHFKAHLRRLLWGAPQPAAQPRGRLLLGFGLTSWVYSVLFLALMLWGFFSWLWGRWGWLGLGAVVLLGGMTAGNLFRGISAGEVRKMILLRHKRVVVWGLLLGVVAAVLVLVQVEDRASGPFQVRPAIRAELRAPVAGFLQAVHCDEGDRVSPGQVVACLEVPDLASRTAQKQAEVREAQARLRLLEAGPRYEEVIEQRRRVERARAWCDLARQDLTRSRKALEAELLRLEKQVAQAQIELQAASEELERSKAVVVRRAISEAEYREKERKQQVCQAQLEQAQAEKRAREAKGVQEGEAEVARREKEMADAQAALTLLEAGARTEAIEAERARLARLVEEARYLEGLQGKLRVTSVVAGVVTTPRVREKVGQYFREGELICVVEETEPLEVEIALAEQEVARVQPGQEILLKARALPMESFTARVARVAPAAGRGEVQGTVTVYGRMDSPPAELRPGMTGYARVRTGERAIGGLLLDRVLRFVRTEYWW
jgi:multidrug efflux pump subunit AcrA (membrane-fusion protein)